MQGEKCLGTLGAALMIVIAALGLASGAAASSYKVLHNFKEARTPYGSLIFDAAGNLYGTTAGGGASGCGGFGCGTVWKLAPNPNGTWTWSALHFFKGSDGANPVAGLIFDAAGNLYGTTLSGGAHDGGVVFKLAPNPDGTWTESVLYRFTGGADGTDPQAGLIFDAAGNLYGTTQNGGALTACIGGCGVVFKLAHTSRGWSETVLHSFTGADGERPFAGLVSDAAGNLYGTTPAGGAYGNGVVFKTKK